MTTGSLPDPLQYGSGLILDTFRGDARDLSPSDFEERHGAGFLLLTAAPSQAPPGPAMTEVRLDDDEPGSECTADISLLAFPLVRNQRSAGHLITLGRTSNNDVVIPDLSVSRFHAFLKPGSNGGFLLQDASSTNGTTVNSNSVPAQGQGAPIELKSGDSLRVGQVEFSFLSAPALQEFVRAHDD